MTEWQIEMHVERATDRIDAQYMRGEMTMEQYDAKIKALSKWAEEQYEQH